MPCRKRYQKRNKKNKKKAGACERKTGLQTASAPAESTVRSAEDGRAVYKPEYCIRLLEHSVGGGTLAEFAFSIKVTLSEMNEWAELSQEFKRALELAALGSEAFWWQLARNSMKYKFNTAVWKFVMESLFGFNAGSPPAKPGLTAEQQDQYIMIFPEQEDQSESENET